MAEPSFFPIYATGSKYLPKWMRSSHMWQPAVAVDKLPKYQLMVKMCCPKCEEKVIEEIQEVPGVFDVRAERRKSKVVVVASSPAGLDEHEVLRKARKVSRKAKFVELDDSEKPKKKDDDKKKKKEEEEKKKKQKEKEEAEKKRKQKEKDEAEKKRKQKEKDEAEKKRKQKEKDEAEKKRKQKEKEKAEKEEAECTYPFKPYMHWGPSPYYSPFPVAYMAGEYHPSQTYAPHYQYPPLTPLEPYVYKY